MRTVTKAGYVHDLPGLVISEQSFSFRIPQGELKQASFRVRAEDDSRVRGILTSSCHRLVPAVRDFSGTASELRFAIDTRGLRPGDSIQGNLLLITDLGEAEVSVSAEVTDQAGTSFDPQVLTLDDFAQVCKKSMREGFRLFTDPGFRGILNGKNRPFQALYKGMSHNPVTYQHLEEFLVSTGKKEAIELTLDKKKRAVYELGASQKDTLYIYRNTWGYVRLEVETEGEFLETDRFVITSDDFIGKVCGLEYIVRRDRMGEGKSRGRILLHGLHQELVYEVEASPHEESEILSAAVRNRRISWLFRDFLSLRLHRKDFRTWLDGSMQIVREMLEDDPDDRTACLIQAYLQFSAEDMKGAMETLWPFRKGEGEFQDPEEKGAFLYLAKETGLLPEEKRNIVPALRRYYSRKPSSYILMYLLQQETEEENRTSAEYLTELETGYENGCCSPFLYLDAWLLLRHEEALLRRLSPFMIRVLSFGQKIGQMTEGLILRAAFLSSNLKQWSANAYRLLVRGYEAEPSPEILEAICKLVIKGDPGKPEYFRWYDLALRQDLRITRLYEYYMQTYSGTARDDLPMQVKMYFASNQTLGEKKRALLYANIVQHKEEDMTCYMNYARQIRAFAVDAIRKGRIDENYAVIYDQFLSKPETRETAELLSNVLFACRLTCSDRRMRKVVVCHQALREEEYYPLIDGTAYPCLYTEDACVLLEDEKHRRFSTSVARQIEPLLGNRAGIRRCVELGAVHPGLILSLCREKAYQMDVTGHNLDDYRKAAASDAFTDEYRAVVRRKILEYCLAHPEDPQTSDCIPAGETDAWAAADRKGTAEFLIREGRYEDAAHVLSESGYETLDPALLLRLASRLILQREFAADEMLIRLTWHVFDADKYDEVMLVYLRDHYDGSLFDLERLWEKVRGFQLESVRLEEKILQQAMFVHSFPIDETAILSSCIRQNGSQTVIRRFLEYLCSWYFLSGRPLDEEIFTMVRRETERDNGIDPVCRLALLKHWSEKKSLTPEQEDLCRQFLKAETDAGRRFAFYRNFPAKLTQAWQIEDKYFIQEQLRPDSRVILHYRRCEAGMEPGDWVSEPMRNIYEGIFVKEFLLFYGETLTWYLSVLEDGEIRRTEEQTYVMQDADTDGTTKYRLLNRMLEAREKKDYKRWKEAAEMYQRQEKVAGELLEML